MHYVGIRVSIRTQTELIWKRFSIKNPKALLSTVKDTDEGGSEDGHNGSYGDGALSVFQVPRPVRSSHYTWRVEKGEEL